MENSKLSDVRWLPTVVSEVVIITPQMAADWLRDANKGNRKLNEAHARRLADQISAGQYLLTHQGIAFDRDGRLVDGQHRLRAIVLAGQPVQMLVTRGLQARAFLAVDSGAIRTAGHTLGIAGHKNASRIAGIARTLAFAGTANHRINRSLVLYLAERFLPTIELYEQLAVRWTVSTAAAFVASSLIGRNGVEEASNRLFGLMFDGPGDPMRALARRLDRERGANGADSTRMRFTLTCAALRAVHEGRDLERVLDQARDTDICDAAAVWVRDWAAGAA